MNNKEILLERILMNMKYDSRKTLSENKILLSEDGPTSLTFNGPSTRNLSQIVKYTTVGKILSKVSNNLGSLKEVKYEGNDMIIVGKKYLQYDEGTVITNHNNKRGNCISERYPNGRAKTIDNECYRRFYETLNSLEKQRHTFCLSRILYNQSLLNLPFAIEVSNDGIYKIYFFLRGEDCEYGGFDYYLETGNTYLNDSYPLRPFKVESISKPKPVINKIIQKPNTENLTLDEKKEWCKKHGKDWSEELNSCISKGVTVSPNSNNVQMKPKGTEDNNKKEQFQQQGKETGISDGITLELD